MRQLIGSLLAVCIALFAGYARAADAVPVPNVTGPTSGGTHGQPFGAMAPADLAKSGYTE
jgi:hypothetical protein